MGQTVSVTVTVTVEERARLAAIMGDRRS